ncbi:MAG: transposase [bacterium]
MTNAGTTHCPLAWVVMPNHVHLLTRQIRGHELGKVVNQIKALSARRINRLCSNTGKLWQRAYFDRVMRDMDQLRRTVSYIHENPVQAGLVESAAAWPFSSAGSFSEVRLEEVLGG